MDGVFEHRYRILGIILACYGLPFLLLGVFGSFIDPLAARWITMALSLLVAAVGSLALFLILLQWESRMISSITEKMAPKDDEEISLKVDSEKLRQIEELHQTASAELDRAHQQLAYLETELAQEKSHLLEATKERERLGRELKHVQNDFEQFRIATEEKLEQNHIFLREYQHTINEQRVAAETKQRQIEQLESKVSDLTYEIKTLLQLAEKGRSRQSSAVVPLPLGGHLQPEATAPSRVFQEPKLSEGLQHSAPDTPPQNPLSQLRHCLDIAQRSTGASYQSPRPHGRDLLTGSNALEMRRLFDSLQSEATSALWVYSQTDQKLLFANSIVKPLLGWTPDKLIQNFAEIIAPGISEWDAALAELAYKSDCQVSLSMKSKNGSLMLLKCYLGAIPTGLFKGRVICIAQMDS